MKQFISVGNLWPIAATNLHGRREELDQVALLKADLHTHSSGHSVSEGKCREFHICAGTCCRCPHWPLPTPKLGRPFGVVAKPAQPCMASENNRFSAGIGFTNLSSSWTLNSEKRWPYCLALCWSMPSPGPQWTSTMCCTCWSWSLSRSTSTCSAICWAWFLPPWIPCFTHLSTWNSHFSWLNFLLWRTLSALPSCNWSNHCYNHATFSTRSAGSAQVPMCLMKPSLPHCCLKWPAERFGKF